MSDVFGCQVWGYSHRTLWRANITRRAAAFPIQTIGTGPGRAPARAEPVLSIAKECPWYEERP